MECLMDNPNCVYWIFGKCNLDSPEEECEEYIDWYSEDEEDDY